MSSACGCSLSSFGLANSSPAPMRCHHRAKDRLSECAHRRTPLSTSVDAFVADAVCAGLQLVSGEFPIVVSEPLL
jgi:hypothetical protein